jgi:hypothetical protein
MEMDSLASSRMKGMEKIKAERGNSEKSGIMRVWKFSMSAKFWQIFRASFSEVPSKPTSQFEKTEAKE